MPRFSLLSVSAHALVAALLIGFCCTAIPWRASADSQRTLRVVSLHAPPLSYRGDDGRPAGLLMEIVSEGLRRAGFRAEFDILPWRRCLEEVRSGQADAIFYAGFNRDRAEYLHYPMEPLYHEEALVWRRAGSAPHLRSDLANAATLRIGVGLGFHFGPRMDSLLSEGGFGRVERLAEWERCLWMLRDGRLDIYLGYRIPTCLQLRVEGLEGQLEVQVDERGQPVVWGRSPTYLCFSRKSVSRDEVRAFDTALSGMKQDESYDAVLARLR